MSPLHVSAVNVTTNIAICTLAVPNFFPNKYTAAGVGNSFPSICFDLLSYEIVAGSSGVGTVVTFQTLQLNSPTPPATQIWGTLTTGGSTSTPYTLTLANSTSYGDILNGPFLGVQMLVSNATGNGIAYARLTGMVRSL